MRKLDNFQGWFNRSFWRALNNLALPIDIPKTIEERKRLVSKVQASIENASYSPSIPAAEIIVNKGYGVSRTVPIFCIEDYCVYYFCIKELEGILCVNRTENTFGGWSCSSH